MHCCPLVITLDQLNAAKSGAQAQEWAVTDMAAAVATFRSCFLDALQASWGLARP